MQIEREVLMEIMHVIHIRETLKDLKLTKIEKSCIILLSNKANWRKKWQT